MKTYYDLTSEEREKYRKEFKNTPVGKELHSILYWIWIILFVGACIFGYIQGYIFDVENMSNSLTTMVYCDSFIIILTVLFVTGYYFYINLNFSSWLKNKYKIKRW